MELKIEKEAAIKAHDNTDQKGKKLLEDLLGPETFIKDVAERIKTIDDVLRDHNISSAEAKQKLETLKAMGLEHMYYQWLAELTAKSLNEGWIPDWDNSVKYKYYPWFKMGSSGFRYDNWTANSDFGSRLCFKSSKLAKYAGNQFLDLYKTYFEK